MDKSCSKFIPIALFSFRYKCKYYTQTPLPKQNFTTSFLLVEIHKTAREQTRSNCVEKLLFRKLSLKDNLHNTQKKNNRGNR